MVKFKFPGKPSKIVQRSLISAYSVVVPNCDSSSVSEDVCYGLSVFYDTFGSDEKVRQPLLREPFNVTLIVRFLVYS